MFDGLDDDDFGSYQPSIVKSKTTLSSKPKDDDWNIPPTKKFE
jgi:hypothetical protein